MSDNVLVTGQAALGAPTLSGQLLFQKGHQVTAIDDLSTGRLQNIRHLQPLPHFQFVRETITSY